MPDLHRRRRPGGREVRGPRGRRLHLHVGQGHGALHRAAHPRREEGAEAGRPRRSTHRPHDRDQALLRDDAEAALDNTRFWSPLSLSQGAEARHHRPGRDGAGGRRAADRADRQALDRRHRPRRVVAEISSTSTGASTTSSSTPRGTTSAGSSSSSSATSRRGCGRARRGRPPTPHRVAEAGLDTAFGLSTGGRRQSAGSTTSPVPPPRRTGSAAAVMSPSAIDLDRRRSADLAGQGSGCADLVRNWANGARSSA